jgi:hypothetical protein
MADVALMRSMLDPATQLRCNYIMLAQVEYIASILASMARKHKDTLEVTGPFPVPKGYSLTIGSVCDGPRTFTIPHHARKRRKPRRS